ncbi:MAG: gamma-glutamyl-gamma-aminobutyrate hydrolase family protein [Candidatus Schekmanbacteria bacterium]|nr:gamma-glutamyl-gamma-aminobutyrate hydrolase family protein [Candidatus Schekmanbacteria bacterium]
MRPLIGITCDYTPDNPVGRIWLREDYASAVYAAGGWPLLLPPLEDMEIEQVMPALSGLMITGGDFDIEPGYYGEKPLPQLGKLNPRRSLFEAKLIRRAIAQNIPTLGICGGLQAINVVCGGSLYQDVSSQLNNVGSHEGQRLSLAHSVRIQPATKLSAILGRKELMVNSSHHQAVKAPGTGLQICAVTPDGLTEAMEHSGLGFMLGVQWHPESLYRQEPLWLKLFEALVEAASKKAKG